MINIKDEKFELVRFAQGEILFKEGDIGDYFYLIEEGKVEVFIQNVTFNSEINIASFTKGETVGELSLMTNLPRNASARALTPVVAVKITTAEYTQRIKNLPHWVILVLNGLARRIQSSVSLVSEEHFKTLKNTIEIARMGKELQIAKTVQDTLFPVSRHQYGNLEIVGHYQSASECGGDWWHTCESGGKVFLWIGDATGHGVSAALITSAARAVASVLEHSNDLHPGRALETLNRAIFDTSKGKVMMTFFLASYDKNTSELCYANASHDPVCVSRRLKDSNQKDTIIFLDQVNGSRLGEAPECKYEEATFKLVQGDVVLAYTDGVTGLVNTNGKAWGEVNLMKALCQAKEQSKDAVEIVEHLKKDILEYKSYAILKDDVTFFILRQN